MDDVIRAGQCAVVNGSRTIVNQARDRYDRTAVVLIDCPIEARTRRLTSRGRESDADVISRLHRTIDSFKSDDADLIIDNGGPLADSVATLTEFLLSKTCRPIL